MFAFTLTNGRFVRLYQRFKALALGFKERDFSLELVYQRTVVVMLLVQVFSFTLNSIEVRLGGV